MIELLQSLKSDLLSRRLLPLLALLGVALVAAVAYAVGGAGGGSPAPVAKSAPNGGRALTLPVTAAPVNPHLAVSETPSGSRYQSQGPTRDPFVPLPSPPAAKSASAGRSSSSSSKSKGSSSTGSSKGKTGSTGGSGSGGEKAPAPAPKKPAKPQFPYIVSVLFGRASTTAGQPATLTPYQSLKLLQPLPSKQDTRVSFERVTANGKGAVFKLVVAPILHGTGVCLPSTSECETIDVEAGHAEELEYIEASGQAVVYELEVVSIIKKSGIASAARVKDQAKAARTQSKPRAAQAIGDASSVRALALHG
jgi:hypothetical protein